MEKGATFGDDACKEFGWGEEFFWEEEREGSFELGEKGIASLVVVEESGVSRLKGGKKVVGGRGLVGVSEDGEKGFGFRLGKGENLVVEGGVVGIDDSDKDIRACKCLLGADFACLSKRSRIVPATSIEPKDGAEGKKFHSFFDDVGGSAGMRRGDGNGLACDEVKKGGFPCVGTTDEGDGELLCFWSGGFHGRVCFREFVGLRRLGVRDEQRW